MEYVLGYLLFALTTGICAMYELYWPVFRELEFKHPESALVEFRWTAGITALLGFTLLAPLMLIPCVLPAWGEQFRLSFYLGVLDK